jgi:EmrB/QacA subfamily drug resistance transporter
MQVRDYAGFTRPERDVLSLRDFQTFISDDRHIRFAKLRAVTSISNVVTSTDPNSLRGDVWLLSTVCVVTSLIMLDSNVVAVALPAIRTSLGASYSSLQWIIGAYVLPYSALLMAAGSFADRYGRRLSMVIGLTVFAIASLACGLTSSIESLNSWRAIQGVGGAMLLTASMAILAHRCTGVRRTKAFALWGASIGTAMAAGPIVGGLMTNFLGWRSIFLINPPVCAFLIAGSLRFVEESRDPHAQRIDVAGILTLSGALGFLVYALISGNSAGWTSALILSCFAGFAAFAICFVLVERAQKRPMVDFGLFQQSTFIGSVAAMMGYGASAQVLIFILPPMIQTVHRFEPMYAGAAMIPFALPMVLAPKIAARLSARFSGRALLTAGLLGVCAGNVAMAVAALGEASYAALAGGMLITGCGGGILNGLTIKVLESAVKKERAGMASGLASTTRYLGILVSVAGLGAIANLVIRHTLASSVVLTGASAPLIAALADHVAAGDLEGALAIVPAVRAVGTGAFATGSQPPA